MAHSTLTVDDNYLLMAGDGFAGSAGDPDFVGPDRGHHESRTETYGSVRALQHHERVSQHDSDGQPVEVQDTVAAADRHRFRYEVSME
jgi:hypothetical protein